MGTSVKKVRLYIGGMTCINCQSKIEKALGGTEGIDSARVSYSKGTADIAYARSKISEKEIIAVIENLDYSVLPEGRQGADMVKLVGILVIIISLYQILQSAGLLNLLAPSQLADTKMGYGMLFIIGLITSVHCIAMCGGINLSQCIPQAGQSEAEKGGKLSAFGPALAYNLGRVVSYTAIGFVLGLAGFLFGGGTEVGLSVLLQGIVKIIAGLFMVIMGINMLDLFPELRKYTVRLPKPLARRIGREKAKSSRPFIVGILNGVMPCGPLQSMWLVALAAGNPFAGALAMFLFSLGTVPLMLGLGSAVSALGKKFTHQVMTVGSVLVVVLGLAMLSQGGALSGWLSPDLLLVCIIAFSIAGVLLHIPVRKKQWKGAMQIAALAVIIGSCALWRTLGTQVQSSAASGTQAETADGVQVVNSTLSIGRYPNITVQAGVPVKWVIDAPEGSLNGCNYKVLIPDYDIEYTFHTGENVIEFTPTEVGTVRYSCWMGMIYGSIFVTDGTESSTAVSDGGSDVPVPAGYSIPTDRLAAASLSSSESGTPFQEVSTSLTAEGFSPAVIVVQSGVNVVWNLDIEAQDGESQVNLLVPAYSRQLSLGEGVNQLSLYPTESFEMSTGDNRYYCYIKVVDDLDAVDEEAVREEVSAFEPMIYPASVFERAGMSCCG